jgi:ferrous-iron efflux pump FieF
MPKAPPLHNPHRSKEFSLRIATITTFLSLIPTAYVAFSSNSIILLTDFLRCAAEFTAILLSWLIVRRIAKNDHSYFDYGFGKLEQMASLAVACALFASFIAVLALAAIRIYHPVVVENAYLGLIFAILSVLGNLAFWIYNKKLAKTESSPILDSQSDLFRAKTLASFVVAGSLALSLGNGQSAILLYSDPAGSLILAGFLLFSAIKLLSSSMRDLLDCSIDEVLRLKVLRSLVKYEAQYLGLESILSRRVGSKAVVEITLEFSENLVFSDVYNNMQIISTDLTNAIGNCSIIIVPKAVRAK